MILIYIGGHYNDFRRWCDTQDLDYKEVIHARNMAALKGRVITDGEYILSHNVKAYHNPYKEMIQYISYYNVTELNKEAYGHEYNAVAPSREFTKTEINEIALEERRLHIQKQQDLSLIQDRFQEMLRYQSEQQYAKTQYDQQRINEQEHNILKVLSFADMYHNRTGIERFKKEYLCEFTPDIVLKREDDDDEFDNDTILKGEYNGWK